MQRDINFGSKQTARKCSLTDSNCTIPDKASCSVTKVNTDMFARLLTNVNFISEIAQES